MLGPHPKPTEGQHTMANWKHEITLTVWHESETDDGRAAADVFGQQIIREVACQLTPRADLLRAHKVICRFPARRRGPHAKRSD